MQSLGLIIGLVLIRVQSNNAVTIPTIEEITYKYSAVSRAAHEDYNFQSQYKIKGALQISGLNKFEIAVRLTNVTYSLHNDNYVTENNTGYSPANLPKLSLPFLVEYKSNGLIESVSFDPEDEIWSKNIKKSIATLYQVHEDVYTSDFKNKSEIIEPGTDVDSTLPSSYNVTAQDAGVLLVHKSYRRRFTRGATSILEIENQIIRSIRSDVRVKDWADTKTIVHITRDLIMVSRKQGISDWAATKQDWVKEKVNIDVKNLALRLNANMDEIKHLLEKVMELKNTQITLKRPKMENADVFNRLIENLRYLNATELKTIHESLDTEKEKIFWDVLPWIGTIDSVNYATDITIKPELTKKDIRLLSNLLSGIRDPDWPVLSALSKKLKETFLHLSKTNFSVYKKIMLEYSTFIYRSLDFLGGWYVQFFVKTFISNYHKLQSHNAKILQLECLGNIKIHSTYQLLENLFRDESDPVLRLYAIQALGRTKPQRDKLDTFLLEVIKNKTETFEVRSAAYRMLLETPTPDVSDVWHTARLVKPEVFFNLSSLEHEDDERMYIFHYDTMKSFVKPSKYIKWTRESAKVAGEILDKAREPLTDSLRGIKVHEYMDHKGNNGYRLEYSYIHIPGGFHATGKLFVKQFGEKRFGDEENFGEIDDESFAVDLRSENHTLRVTIQKNGQTTASAIIPNISWDALPKLANLLSVALNETDNHTYELLTVGTPFDRTIISDFGAPIKQLSYKNGYISLKLKFDPDWKKMDFNLKRIKTYGTGIKVYNPINNVWHGYQDVFTSLVNIPFKVEIDTKSPPHTDKLRIVVQHPDKEHPIGMQYYAEREVFVHNMDTDVNKHFNILGDDIQDSYVVPVTNGNTIKDYNLIQGGWNIESRNCTRLLKLFDCDYKYNEYEINGTKFDVPDHLYEFPAILLKTSTTLNKKGGNCGIGYAYFPTGNILRHELEFQSDKLITFKNDTINISYKMLGINNNTLLALQDQIQVYKCDDTLKLCNISGKALVSTGNNTTKIKYQLLSELTGNNYQLNLTVDREGDRALVTIIGNRSAEQETDLILDHQCKSSFNYNSTPITKTCLLAASAFRNYYEIEAIDDQKYEKVTQLVYPLGRGNEVDITCSEGNKYSIDNPFAGLTKTSYLPPVNQFFGIFGGINPLYQMDCACAIAEGIIMDFDYKITRGPLSTDWETYLYIDTDWLNIHLTAKKNTDDSGLLAMRLLINSNTLIEILPGSNWTATINGTAIPNEMKNSLIESDKFKYLFTTHPRILFRSFENINVYYNALSIRIETYSSVALMIKDSNEENLTSMKC